MRSETKRPRAAGTRGAAVALGVSILIGVGCATRGPQRGFAEGAPFDTYHTYAIRGRSSLDDPSKQTILAGLRNALSARGLEEQPIGADLEVWLYVPTASQPDHLAYAVAPETASEWQGGIPESRELQHGSVALQLVDRKARKLVWSAIDPGALRGKVEKQTDEVTRAIAALLEGFPPQPAS